MFLRKLYDAYFIIKESISHYEQGSPEWQLEQDKMQLLKTIIQFIKTDGVKQAPARAKLDALMRTHFNYELVANMFRTTPNSIKSSISYVSKSVESKVGVDTLQLLLEGNINEAHSNFLKCSKKYSLDDLVITDIKTIIPYQIPRFIKLVECQDELNFFKVISKEHLSTLDINKLVLIRYILESRDIRHQHERQLLVSYLKGVIDLEEFCTGVSEGVW